MDSATVLVIAIVSFLFALTFLSIYTAFGPGSEQLEDTLLNHSHGPGDHSHSHGHGQVHSHAYEHAHDHHGQNMSHSG